MGMSVSASARVLAALAAFATAAACERTEQTPPPTSPAVSDAVVRPLPASAFAAVTEARPRIEAFVRALDSSGIAIAERSDGLWEVVRPRSEGYVVVVHLRVYSRTISEADMRRDLSLINLAFIPNVSARMAMSYPGVIGHLPAGIGLKDLAVTQALLRAFESFSEDSRTR